MALESESLRLVIACLPGLMFGLALAGCDRQKAAAPQGEAPANASAAAAPAQAYPTGRLDRSHAGTPAPGVTFEDGEGRPVRLSVFRGRPVLVNLWATWCGPCRKEMPALDRLQAALGGEKFSVVPISIDTGDPERPRQFLDSVGVKNLPLYTDRSTDIFEALKTRSLALGLPVTLLLDRNGCRLGHINGPAEWDSEEGKRLIEAAIGAGATQG
jgi:thiol-disulfide isomerase/thioredoxin